MYGNVVVQSHTGERLTGEVRSLQNGNDQNFSQKASCDIKISSGDVQEHLQSRHSPQLTMEHIL